MIGVGGGLTPAPPGLPLATAATFFVIVTVAVAVAIAFLFCAAAASILGSASFRNAVRASFSVVGAVGAVAVAIAGANDSPVLEKDGH